MATPVTKMTQETDYYGRFALSGYNAFTAGAPGNLSGGFDNTAQAAFTTVATVTAAMDALIAAQNYDKAEELRCYRNDWVFGAGVLGVTSADVANSDTVAVFQALIAALFSNSLPIKYLTQEHHDKVSA